jgi:uncharacterized repeat protein (TIGR02543 family)
MGIFIRQSSSPADKYGQIVYYYDGNGFVRKSTAPSDKYGAIVYYIDELGFVRTSSSPADKYGQIVYYYDNDGFIRKSSAPSDKYGAIVYYVDELGFVRKSSSPSDKYGQILFFLQKQPQDSEIEQSKPSGNGGALLALAFVIALIFAPVLIVLGMFGKFLLGGTFKNVLKIEEFKKFRKNYTIICLLWQVLAIAAIVVLAILKIDVTYALYGLVGINILLLVLSMKTQKKIYNKYKDDPKILSGADDKIKASDAKTAEPKKSESYANGSTSSNAAFVHQPVSLDDKKKIFELLAELKKLRDADILTEEEYLAQKEELLSNTKVGVPAINTATQDTTSDNDAVYSIIESDTHADTIVEPITEENFTTESIEQKKSRKLNTPKKSTIILASVISAIFITLTVLTFTIFIPRSQTLCFEDQGDYYVVYGGKYKKAKKIEIPATYEGKPVTAIGDYAFQAFNKLSSVTIPDSVTTIGDYAFNACSRLSDITIPNSVTSISEGTFSYSGLSNITIPDSVTTIGEHAFYYCTSLSNITIPDSVTTIGEAAFGYCTSLSGVTISNSVTTINDFTFCDCTSLSTITIPDSVTTIGEYAFVRCSALTSAIIGDSVITIECGAFGNCTNLTSISFPSSITSIEDYVFEYCSNLTDVEYKGTFNDWQQIYISPSNTELLSLLIHCSDGKKCTVTLDNNNDWGTNSIVANEYGTTLPIPDDPYRAYYKFDGWYKDSSCNEAWDFMNDTTTSNITLYAKWEYTGLDIKDNILIGVQNSENVAELIIPDGVTIIDRGALSSRNNITHITIPDSVTSIEDWSIDNCNGLTSVIIGKSVTNIGDSAFWACNYLVDVYYNGTIEDWCNITFESRSSNPMSHHAENFYILDDNGDVEFHGKNYSLITELVIHHGITEIKYYAFNNFGQLKSIIIPNSVTSIGYYAFLSCDNLVNVYYNGTIAEWCNIYFESDWSNPMINAENFYILDDNGDIEFHGKNYSLLTDLVIPDGVTELKNYAFYDFYELENVVMPSSITSVGVYGGFPDCNNLYYNGTLEDWYNIYFESEWSNLIDYVENFYILDDNGNVEFNGNRYSLLTNI